MTDILIVIPTVTGREASLERCVAAYERHTFNPYRIQVVDGDGITCGEAWAKGAQGATETYVHLSADDLEPHPYWDLVGVQAVIGGQIPCPTVYEPDGTTIQSTHGVSCSQGISTEPVTAGQPVGFTTVPLLRRDWFARIGMPALHYCSDTWISVQARALFNIPTVAEPRMAFTHHNEAPGRGSVAGDQHAQTSKDRALFDRLLLEHTA